MAAGCQHHEKQIRDLNLKVQDLEAANRQLSMQIQSGERDFSDKLLSKDDQLRAMESQLATKNADIEGLRASLDKASQAPKAADGWKSGRLATA